MLIELSDDRAVRDKSLSNIGQFRKELFLGVFLASRMICSGYQVNLGFAFAVIALNLHRAAVPIEVCFRVPASSMRLPRLLHGRIFGLAQPYLS